MPPIRIPEIPVDTPLMGETTIKRGDKLDNPRGGSRFPFRFQLDEGFAVLESKIKRFADEVASNSGIVLQGPFKVYFRRSKTAVQSQYQEISNNEFEDAIKYRWSKISQGDLTKWEREGKTAAESLVFEFFVYLPKRRRSTTQATTSLRRATAPRIREAAEALRRYEANNQTTFGPIQRNHLAITLARQPEALDNTQELEIPNDNTTRQAAAMDRAASQERQQEQQQQRASQEYMRTIKMEINNTLVDVRVDIRTLRTALSLPQHDIFHEGIYTGYQHPDINEEDNIEDVDHDSDDDEAYTATQNNTSQQQSSQNNN